MITTEAEAKEYSAREQFEESIVKQLRDDGLTVERDPQYAAHWQVWRVVGSWVSLYCGYDDGKWRHVAKPWYARIGGNGCRAQTISAKTAAEFKVPTLVKAIDRALEQVKSEQDQETKRRSQQDKDRAVVARLAPLSSQCYVECNHDVITITIRTRDEHRAALILGTIEAVS